MVLPLFDFLTVIDKKDIRKGVEYMRHKVYEIKGLKRNDKKQFDEFLDKYFIQTWLKKKID
jgi:hypothetical protein